MTRLRLTGAGLAMVTVAAGVPAAASAVPVITMSGSTSVAPLAAKLARGYIRSRHKIRVKLAQGGSDIGIADVGAGRVTIGNSSRDPKPTDPGGIVFNKIARDAICLTTNSRNRLPNLSQAQVVAIYSGQIRNWQDIPGSTVTGPIDVVARNAASGTHDAFQKIIMGSTQVSTTASSKASNGLVQQAVRSDPNAIGYVSLAFTGGNNAVSFQGVGCTLRNAKSEQYTAVRNFWMVTRGRPTGAAAKFISWIQGNRKANRIISSEWVPLH